jgi:hypothetical protein
MDNAAKLSHCINAPLSQTFRSYKHITAFFIFESSQVIAPDSSSDKF